MSRKPTYVVVSNCRVNVVLENIDEKIRNFSPCFLRMFVKF